jgi:hypothetical protein
MLREDVLQGGGLAGEDATVLGRNVSVGQHENLGLIVLLRAEEGNGLGGSVKGVVAGVEHHWIRHAVSRVQYDKGLLTDQLRIAVQKHHQ